MDEPLDGLFLSVDAKLQHSTHNVPVEGKGTRCLDVLYSG